MSNKAAFIKTVTVFALLVLLFTGMPIKHADAANGVVLEVDIWTDRGGMGPGMPGGTYMVGEQTILYVSVNIGCETRLTIVGPTGAYEPVISLLQPGIFERPLGIAEEVDIGQWTVQFEGAVPGQYASDTMTFFVVGSGTQPSPTPPQSSPSPSPPPSPTPSGSSGNGMVPTELDALIAMKMAEGSIPEDLAFDVDGDGQVTMDDARTILHDAVMGTTGQSSSSSSSSSSPPPSPSPSPTSSPPPSPSDSSTIQLQPEGSDGEGYGSLRMLSGDNPLLGKWKMTRVSVEPSLPDAVPGFVVNLIVDDSATWEIVTDQGKPKVKYGNRDTWYKRFLIGSGINAGTTTVRQVQPGTYVFETPCTYYKKSLPFPLNLTARGIKEVQATFISRVQITVSGDTKLDAVITLDNVDGTYIDSHQGTDVQKPIDFGQGRVVYTGVKK